MSKKTKNLYIGNQYLDQNPNWHREDSQWKAKIIAKILEDYKIQPKSICEVGCGAGDVLRYLKSSFPHAGLYGFDISPHAAKFWDENQGEQRNVAFKLGDFHQINTMSYDVLMMLDVFEHVRDPFSFLENSRPYAQKFVFHIPLDLSASSVARKMPLLNSRRSVGHLHFYNKDLALETLRGAGYRIIDWRYTGASLNSPKRAWKTQLASMPRRLLWGINKDMGVRLLGGETLLVLAE
jgi:cyclopropane fatty-acyl-phospholipid synthase-like methyltransferase